MNIFIYFFSFITVVFTLLIVVILKYLVKIFNKVGTCSKQLERSYISFHPITYTMFMFKFMKMNAIQNKIILLMHIKNKCL